MTQIKLSPMTPGRTNPEGLAVPAGIAVGTGVRIAGQTLGRAAAKALGRSAASSGFGPMAMSPASDNSSDQANEANQCSEDDKDGCGPLTRREALAIAQAKAQIPRKERDYLSFRDVNHKSRGENCAELQR